MFNQSLALYLDLAPRAAEDVASVAPRATNPMSSVLSRSFSEVSWNRAPSSRCVLHITLAPDIVRIPVRPVLVCDVVFRVYATLYIRLYCNVLYGAVRGVLGVLWCAVCAVPTSRYLCYSPPALLSAPRRPSSTWEQLIVGAGGAIT